MKTVLLSALLFFSSNFGIAIASEGRADRLRALGADVSQALAAHDAATLAAIGRAFERGEAGRERNDDAAALLFGAACEMGGADGCNGLGFMVHQGRGVARDYERAVALFRRSCEAGVARACSNFGHMLEWGQGASVDYKKAEELYRRSCDAGFGGGCVNLGSMFEYGKGAPRNASAAARAYRRALAVDPGGEAALRGLKRLGAAP